MKLDHPLIVLVRGLPGSGKSYVTNALAREIGLEDCVVLDPDATDYESKEYIDFTEQLHKDGVDKKFYPYRYLRSIGHNAIVSNKVIIWNQAFTNLDGFQKTIANLRAHAKENSKELSLIVVEVEIDPQIAKSRITQRKAKGGHDVPEEEFQRFYQDYRSFADEGYDTVQVNGTDVVDISVAKIMTSLTKLAP